MRPLLAPSLHRLLREPGVWQFGTDPQRATVVELDVPNVSALLDLLTGEYTVAELHRAARPLGIGPLAVTTVLDTLAAAGLLRDGRARIPAELPPDVRARLAPEADALALRLPAPARPLRRRWDAKVLVTGSDRLAVPIAAALAAAGVGEVRTELTGTVERSDAMLGGFLPSDAGRPRGGAAADAVRRVAMGAKPPGVRGTAPTFAVLVGHPGPPAELLALGYARNRVPHLPVVVRDGRVVVGPLVRPGDTACLSCLARYRTERDPGWPALAAQLATGRDSEACEAALAVLASGYAALQVLADLDGGHPETVNASVEWSPDGSSRRRGWQPHPDCGCLGRRGGQRRTGRAGTMGG